MQSNHQSSRPINRINVAGQVLDSTLRHDGRGSLGCRVEIDEKFSSGFSFRVKIFTSKLTSNAHYGVANR